MVSTADWTTAGWTTAGWTTAARWPQPCGIGVIELLKCLRGGAGIVECLVVHRWPAEVAGDPGAKHADDEVREPPGDGGDRRGAGLGIGEVDDEVAAAGRDRCASCPRGWMFQLLATGSQKYSASVSPS
jgi:hypothetical protein